MLFRSSSSVGRAQPCQGWGREFESRFPLTGPGGEIGRHAGLKILCPLRTCGFKSRPGYELQKLIFLFAKVKLKIVPLQPLRTTDGRELGLEREDLEIEEILKRDKFIDILDTIYQ